MSPVNPTATNRVTCTGENHHDDGCGWTRVLDPLRSYSGYHIKPGTEGVRCYGQLVYEEVTPEPLHPEVVPLDHPVYKEGGEKLLNEALQASRRRFRADDDERRADEAATRDAFNAAAAARQEKLK